MKNTAGGVACPQPVGLPSNCVSGVVSGCVKACLPWFSIFGTLSDACSLGPRRGEIQGSTWYTSSPSPIPGILLHLLHTLCPVCTQDTTILFFLLAQTKMSWHSLLTLQYTRHNNRSYFSLIARLTDWKNISCWAAALVPSHCCVAQGYALWCDSELVPC
jgi:hypothetical protein